MISVYPQIQARPVVALIFAVFLLPACSLLSEPKEEPVRLNVSMQAVSDLNPDVKSRPAPIAVRVYELKSEATFVQADFFSLQNSDKATLTDDLLARDEFIMRPGERVTIRRKAHPQIGAIGVLAAFRDLPNATWRATYKLQPPAELSWYKKMLPTGKLNLRVSLECNAVRITEE